MHGSQSIRIPFSAVTTQIIRGSMDETDIPLPERDDQHQTTGDDSEIDLGARQLRNMPESEEHPADGVAGAATRGTTPAASKLLPAHTRQLSEQESRRKLAVVVKEGREAARREDPDVDAKDQDIHLLTVSCIEQNMACAYSTLL